MQPGQLQMQQQAVQEGQLQLQDKQAASIAMHQWDGKDINELPALILKNGGSAQAVFGMKNQIVSYQKNLAEMTKDQLANESTKNDMIAGHISNVQAMAPADQPKGFEDAKADLVQRGYMTPQAAQGMQYQGPAQLDALEKMYQAHSQQVDTALKTAGAAKDTAQAGEAVGATAKTAAEMQYYKNNGGGAPGVPVDVQQMNSAIKSNPGLTPANYPAWKAKQEQAATMPGKIYQATAEKSAEQAISDGDPKAAAQLLVSGSVAPSQLVSSRKPAFAQAAFTAAQQMQPGWSATKADADFKVASSPQNVGVFGSAKSMTDKGGTLDQLAAAAKDIPANQVPIFNSVADALKASTGSGPIAKYASIALGVADDYSKVMGGGQGSDTSRTQALQLISAKQSPEQRAASIEGIRGAVGSQTNSRIGNNSVLEKMYGGSAPAGNTASAPQASAPPAGATHTAMGSDGKKHFTNAQGQDLGIAQ